MSKNETSFKSGESGNLYGRPEGAKSFTTIVREALKVMSTIKDEDGNMLTNEQLLAKNIVQDAINGKDTQLKKMVWNYLDGMPQQKIDQTINLPRPLLDILDKEQDEL